MTGRRVAGVVLAAGAGRRFGGPKALVRGTPDGPTLVEQAVCRVADSGVGLVVVVVGAESAPVIEVLGSGAWALRRATAHDVEVDLVEADDWVEGMGASLRSGIAVLVDRRDVTASLITLVDLPDLTTAVHERVIGAAGDGSAALVRAAYDGMPGHPVLIGRDHWAGVMEVATGDRGARDYLRQHEPALVECGDLATGRDVDRPTDL